MRGEQATLCLDSQKGALRSHGGSRSTSVQWAQPGHGRSQPLPQQPGLSRRKGSSATVIPAEGGGGAGRCQRGRGGGARTCEHFPQAALEQADLSRFDLWA